MAMPELKTKIKEYRQKAGFKQDELAEKVGVSRETINRLEKELYNPSLKLAMSIAKEFGVTVDELFCLENDLIFKSYLRGMLSRFVKLEGLIKSKNSEAAEKLIDTIINDTQKGIED